MSKTVTSLPDAEPDATDWERVVSDLHLPGLGDTPLRADDGHVYLVRSGFDKRKRLTIEIYRDGRCDKNWFGCTTTKEGIPADARALFVVRGKPKWPTLARKKLTKRDIIRYREIGIDPAERIYQISLWHDPARCIAHLRRHLPGLRVITREEHNAAAQAAEAARTAEANP